MRRVSSLIAVPFAAVVLVAASTLIDPAADVAAQTPKPTTPAPAPKPAGATTAPRAGGIPLEVAGALVAGGSAMAGAGLYALRRRKRQS
jgi:LPXTG-motif cell wall-anchored protein